MYSVYLQSVESFWKLSLLHISESKTPRHIFTSSSLLPLLLSSPLLFFSLLLSSPHLLFSPLLLNFYTFLLSFPLSISPVSPPLSSPPLLSSPLLTSSPLLSSSDLLLSSSLHYSSPLLSSCPLLRVPLGGSSVTAWFLCELLVPPYLQTCRFSATIYVFYVFFLFFFLFSVNFCQFLSTESTSSTVDLAYISSGVTDQPLRFGTQVICGSDWILVF